MERIVINRSVGKYVVFLICSWAFVAAGVFILWVGGPRWVGWMNIIFFGAGSLVFLWQIFDSRPRLIIDEQGILDRTLGVGVIHWADIEGAYTRSIQGNDFICLQLRNTDQYVRRLSKVKRAMIPANEALGFAPLNINLSGIRGMTDRVLELILKKSEQYRH